MSDIDAYVDDQPKHWAIQKQNKFEYRVLSDLLRALEAKPGMARHVIELAGDSFGAAWFAHAFPNFPVRLSTFKANKPIPIQTLLKNPQKLPILRELTELAANYPDDHWGLVFASDGDGLPDMVIHTRIDWDVTESYWRIMLPESKLVIVDSDQLIHRKWVIDPLKGFADGVKTYGGWQLDESNLEGEI